MSNNEYGVVERLLLQKIDKIIERFPRGSRLYSNGVIIALAVYVVNTVSGRTPEAVFFRWGAAATGVSSFLILLACEIKEVPQKNKARRKQPRKPKTLHRNP
ncbi:MAG: hypothetical protein P8Y47_14020 [Alphaproteobacteria bacterium]